MVSLCFLRKRKAGNSEDIEETLRFSVPFAFDGADDFTPTNDSDDDAEIKIGLSFGFFFVVGCCWLRL